MISLDKLPQPPSCVEPYEFNNQWWVKINTNTDYEVTEFGPNDAPILRQIADWLDAANKLDFQVSDSHTDLENYYEG